MCSLKFVKVCLYVSIYLFIYLSVDIAKKTIFIKRDEIIKCDSTGILYYLIYVPISKQISGANDLKNDLSFW